MEHKLPELPYAQNALEPHISAETLQYHHSKHHAKYVNDLNRLIKGTEFEDMALEDIIRRASGKIFNNAAQTWNHTFYWNCMSPSGPRAPEGELAARLDAAFGSFDAFKQEFAGAAADNFASGWTWLVSEADGRLAVLNTDDADTPLAQGKHALLTLDVWEHAYYIDYRNERPKYIEAFWNIVNWAFVADNLRT